MPREIQLILYANFILILIALFLWICHWCSQ